MKILHKVISLNTAIDRRKDIKLEFERQGLKFSFFEAVRGSELDLSIYRNIYTPYERELSPGEIGCYLSHIGLLREFMETDCDFMVVYEDDVCLKSNYSDQLYKIISKLNKDCFDLLLVGYRNDYLSLWGGLRLNSVKLKRFCDFGWGAHAYVVTKLSAKKILDNFQVPLLPYDCITGGYSQKYDEWKDVSLRIYATATKLVELHDINSEISTIVDREDLRNKSKGNLISQLVRIVKILKPLSRYPNE